MDCQAATDPDGEGAFTPVTRGNKRAAPSSSPLSAERAGNRARLSSEQDANILYNVYLKGSNKDITKMHPDKIKRDITTQFGNVIKITLAGQSLRVTCANPSQQDRLLKCTLLAAEIVTCSLPRSRGITDSHKQNKIIIFNVSLDITNEELTQASGAVHVMRVMKKNEGILAPTTAVVLSYNSQTDPPQVIKFQYLSFRTRQYIPRPLRCSFCQNFGHSQNFCKHNTPTCPLSYMWKTHV